ncbi:uncharacterized protein [Mytilus edulis]|uniref:uncharacterized protein isoform X1 n=1 Tax=Mytilus edulis TaxID=6550 RepID=UPI0039EF00AA
MFKHSPFPFSILLKHFFFTVSDTTNRVAGPETLCPDNMDNIPKQIKKKLKPGVVKKVKTKTEATGLRVKALRSSKCRIINKIKKSMKKLHKEQVYEPVEGLVVLFDVKRKIYKYFGSGDLVTRFEEGQALATGHDLRISKKSRNFTNISKDPVEKDLYFTPNKYKLPFLGGKDLAFQQKKLLDTLAIDKTMAREKTKNLQNETRPSRKELFAERAGSVGKRGTGACRGRGAGGRGRGTGGRGRGTGGRGRGAGGRGAGGRGAGGRGAQGQGSKRGNMTERNGDKRTKKRKKEDSDSDTEDSDSDTEDYDSDTQDSDNSKGDSDLSMVYENKTDEANHAIGSSIDQDEQLAEHMSSCSETRMMQ